MNKKGISTQVLVLCLLVVAIGVAVVILYSGAGSGKKPASKAPQPEVTPAINRNAAKEQYPLFDAVPADAVVVMSEQLFESALGTLTDSTSFLPALLSGTGKRNVSKFLESLKNSPQLKSHQGAVVLSLHYDRELVPLIIIEASDAAASTILSKASSMSLYAKALSEGEEIAVSPSSAVLSSSSRHLEVGTCILDQPSFARAATDMKGRDAIFVVGKYWPTLVPKVMKKPFSNASSFLKDYAEVMIFTIKKQGGLKRITVGIDDKTNPASLANHLSRERIEAARVLPATTVFAIGMATGDISGFIRSQKDFLDANSRLSRYDDSAEKWAKGLDIKEVVKAVILDEGLWKEILCLRLGKPSEATLLQGSGLSKLKEYKPSVIPYAFGEYAPVQFGKAFAIEDDGFFFYKDGWMIVGDGKTLSKLLVDEYQPLEDFMQRNGMTSRGRSPFLWFDATAYSSRAGELLTTEFAPLLGRVVGGIAKECIYAFGNEIFVNRLSSIKTESKGVSIENVNIEVPAGPFTVTNCKTNKKNKLVQNPNKSLSLLDENGKSQWTVPFKEDLCGYVCDIDYYNNKKIQFLFAAGSKLYLLDRLGRFVRDFPAEIAKPVLLGPAVYDFTGAHGYTAIVLHDDNTIGMYDLHGKVREGWQGIAPEQQITALPELSSEKGKKVWKIETPSSVITYPFYGGKALREDKKRK